MFYRLLFLLSIISPFILSAQIATEIKLEPAMVTVKYERKVEMDTLDRGNKARTTILTLKAGKNHSAFYDAKRKWIDSIEYRYDDFFRAQYNGKEYYDFVGKTSSIKLFKNYPEGKIRVHDFFDICRWNIDEDMEKPEWNVTDSTANILGYECIMATTKFRGRVWNVWFTPEIPVSDGPWKLWGLPGLILHASDSNNDYTFSALEVSDRNPGYVEYFDYRPQPIFESTKRIKSLQRKWKSSQENIAYRIATSGMLGDKTPDVSKMKKTFILKYDFEETDYSHE